MVLPVENLFSLTADAIATLSSDPEPQTFVERVLSLWQSVVPETVKTQFRILMGGVTAMWTVELVDSLLLRNWLNRYGIRPRRLNGLSGVIIAPLLHGDLAHLAANTLPFMVLGWFVMLRHVPDFFLVTTLVWLCSGFGVWLLAPSKTNHIGASGLVFGYLGFLLLRGYFERSFVAIALAVLSGLLYGGSIWGLLPIHKGRSWQGHLFGFVTGALIARYITELRDWIQPLIAP
ncbi:MAG: rhomboid family intramembrane serine protease [Cyanobacteria bacterium P01_A01_bin.37]